MAKPIDTQLLGQESSKISVKNLKPKKCWVKSQYDELNIEISTY